MNRSRLNVARLLNNISRKIALHAILKYSLLFLFFSSVSNAFAQTDSIAADTAILKKRKLFVSPVVGYTPETRLYFGAGAVFYLPPSKKYPETNPSVVKVVFVYTQNKQIESNIAGDGYYQNNTYRYNYSANYYEFPAYFFGIGNNTLFEDKEEYDFDFFNIGLNGQKKIEDHFYAGLKTFFEWTKVDEVEPGGFFDTQEITGEDGGVNTGLGAWLTYDTRDNIYFPLSGMYIDVSSVAHTEFLGSDFNYFEQTIEVSQFNKMLEDDALAFNFYSMFLPGEVPFNRLAKLGGEKYMRGNYEGRFRDNYYLTLQSEYRMTFWKYFGINLFAGIGEVANELDKFSIGGLKYSVGLGGRLFIVPEDKLSLRLDIAMGSRTNEEHIFGIKNEIGLYITFREAF